MFQILLDVLHLLFYLIFVVLHLLSFYCYFSHEISAPKMWGILKVLLFSYIYILIYMKTCFNYLLLLFIGKCFKLYFVNLYKLYSIAVFICYLHFVTYSTVHNVFRTLWQVSFLVKFVACGLELGEK